MNIDKDTIVTFLKEQGQHDKAEQAKNELPDTVDHEQQSGMLEKYGIGPKKLLGKVKASSRSRRTSRSREGAGGASTARDTTA